MYLPIDTSFAIFLGGAFKHLLERRMEKGKVEGEVKERVVNTGTLLASGLIAGEALIGIVFAALAFFEVGLFGVFTKPPYWLGLIGILALGVFLVARSMRVSRR
jgi:uncharacterized oligopeptide transporter (OPT) family protein